MTVELTKEQIDLLISSLKMYSIHHRHTIEESNFSKSVSLARKEWLMSMDLMETLCERG